MPTEHLHLPEHRCLRGRGCCAVCWSPWFCALQVRGVVCGCHVPKGQVCRAVGCGESLFISRPEDTRAAASLAADLAAYAQTKKGRKAA